MDNPDLTLDELHDDDNSAVIQPEVPTIGTPDPEPDPEPTPAAKDNTSDGTPEPTPDPELAPAASTDDEPIPEPEPGEPSPADGLELFLSQYDIEGGMITYDDGTSVHISELSAEEQAKILSTVAADARPAIEDQYDLDQKEIDLLNELRTSKKSVEEYVEDLASARFNAYKADVDSRNIDYTSMEDDAVYVKFLKEQNENISESEIEQGLQAAKDNPTYSTLVKGLRENFVKNQAQETKSVEEVEAQKSLQELEKDRQAIVNAASGINDIGGFEIPREVKNDVLHDLLEVNEYGDSLFLESTFSDPNTMFKTAWFSKYGESYLADIENYYKQEITKAYKRGQSAVTQGLPSSPKSINGAVGSSVEKPSGLFDPDAKSDMDLDDLHNKD